MTKEEAIKEYIVPALKRTWNDKVCKAVLEAIEQDSTEDYANTEPNICDTNPFGYKRFGG